MLPLKPSIECTGTIYDSLLRGTPEEAWGRCLPAWEARGRVNDRPRWIRSPEYAMAFGTALGRMYVIQLRGGHLFLLDRLEHGTSVERACAMDLLEFLAQHLRRAAKPVPIEMKECPLPLPSHFQEELEKARYGENRDLSSTGKFLAFVGGS